MENCAQKKPFGYLVKSQTPENGEAVQIVKRGKAFARLVPVEKPTPPRFDPIAHAKRRKETWGNRVFSTAEVKAIREAEFEGEQG